MKRRFIPHHRPLTLGARQRHRQTPQSRWIHLYFSHDRNITRRSGLSVTVNMLYTMLHSTYVGSLATTAPMTTISGNGQTVFLLGIGRLEWWKCVYVVVICHMKLYMSLSTDNILAVLPSISRHAPHRRSIIHFASHIPHVTQSFVSSCATAIH